jgi:hypothetical protein
VASLPFCGEAVAYPIAAGSAAHHRAEDDGIAATHARAVAAMEASLRAGDESSDWASAKDACASALKTEMCRTAFSVCDVRAGNAELEYCAHAHVPSFGAAALVVGVCTRPDRLGAPRLGENGEVAASAAYMGARVVCAARWNGVACFSLPTVCGAVRDTPEGTCPADAKAWRGMAGGCFYAEEDADRENRFADFVAVSKNALAKNARLVTPESAAACASVQESSGGTKKSEVGSGVAVTAEGSGAGSAAAAAVTAADAAAESPQPVPRNATATARETIDVVKAHAAEAFGGAGAENRTDPRRMFTRSDRETGGTLWIFCAQALVAGSLVAAAWTCTRGWFFSSGAEAGGPGGVRWGARRAPSGGPAFSRLKQHTRDVAKPAPRPFDIEEAELTDLPAAAKGSTLATLPKRGAGKGSPEKNSRARQVAEAPF